ncbi:MAG: hypothetical protein ACI9YH_002285 [Colwellia sp.]|jgi:hypothetical protein
MLNFDKLKKNDKNIITTNHDELKKFNALNNSEINPEHDEIQSIIYRRLSIIEQSVTILNKTHPISFNDKAIYDLAETGRDAILDQTLEIKKTIEKNNFDPATLNLLNSVFDLGQKTKSYNLTLGYQQYFVAGQKSEESILKSASIRKIRKESYFDIVEFIFKKLADEEPYSSYKATLKIEAIDKFLQPKIKELSNIRDTVKNFTERGYIKPKRGALTNTEKEQKRELKQYLPNAFPNSFDEDVNEFYITRVNERSQKTYDTATGETKVIELCNKLLGDQEIKSKLFSLPIKVIAEGIVTQFSENAYLGAEKKAYLANKILLEIKLRHNNFYRTTIKLNIKEHHKNTFLDLYTLAKKKAVI